ATEDRRSKPTRAGLLLRVPCVLRGGERGSLRGFRFEGCQIEGYGLDLQRLELRSFRHPERKRARIFGYRSDIDELHRGIVDLAVGGGGRRTLHHHGLEVRQYLEADRHDSQL